MQFFTLSSSTMQISETDFFAILTIHNHQISYVKHVLDPLNVLFTLFGCLEGHGGPKWAEAQPTYAVFHPRQLKNGTSGGGSPKDPSSMTLPPVERHVPSTHTNAVFDAQCVPDGPRRLTPPPPLWTSNPSLVPRQVLKSRRRFHMAWENWFLKLATKLTAATHHWPWAGRCDFHRHRQLHRQISHSLICPQQFDLAPSSPPSPVAGLRA